MSSSTKGLTANKVETLKTPGNCSDGNGLYLQVAKTGAKIWVYRFQIAGRRREMGLKPATVLTLAKAREKAFGLKKLVASGIDPIEQKKRDNALAALGGHTFESCAEAYIAGHKAAWRNEKHAAQWPSSLKTYAYPVFGALPVGAVDTDLVMKVLEPIWTTKTETASRVRQRIETVLD